MEQGSAANEGVPTIETVSPTASTGSTGSRGSGSRLRRALLILVIVLVAAVIWEGLKWIAGDPWRLTALGYFHDPPLRVGQFSDLQLPHLWDIAGAFAQPFQGSGANTLGMYLVAQAAYTWAVALVGFFVGATIGIILASIFVHSAVLERGLVPYVVASQTIPIVALAPMIVTAFGTGLGSVVIIAAYLTFFPVTIAVTRGLRSPDPRALELMRSYAASKWAIYRNLRLPASVPYLFTALKIAAAASIVGTIIGEGPGGGLQGLGRAILTFNQQYITGPERLWATIVVAAAVGLLFFGVVRLVERRVLARRGLGGETA